MKRLLSFIGMLLLSVCTAACPVCERNQPEALKGITHGAGPESRWDYIIVWTMVVIVLITLFFSVKWLIYPGEKSTGHIKRFVVNNP